jgi:hypothetical protein
VGIQAVNYRKFFCSLLLATVVFPGSALAFYKPTRVVLPHLFGVTCPTEYICIDNAAKLAEAEALRTEAIDFVTKNVGHISQVPRFIFCSTAVCANRFGQFHAAAYNVGTFGIVIRTKGWEKHYIRHELIHHLKNERIGSVNAYFFKPKWFVEGMAYSLSKDPRRPIPNAELEKYRRDFERWNDGSDIWKRAEHL